MKWFRAILVILGLMQSNFVFAEAGTEGHGGDELRFRFQEGRDDASSRIEQIRYCSLPSGTREETKQWIIQNRKTLSNDILKSRHQWVTDNQATCAFTQTNAEFPITLSFVACKNVANKEQAGKLLVHESVHHLGFSNEEFADEVATAIYSANDGRSCPSPTEDPFDPQSCSGAPISRNYIMSLFGPGQTDIFLASQDKFRVVARERTCNKVTGCEIWRKADISFKAANTVFTYPGQSSFRVGATIHPDTNILNVYLNLWFSGRHYFAYLSNWQSTSAKIDYIKSLEFPLVEGDGFKVGYSSSTYTPFASIRGIVRESCARFVFSDMIPLEHAPGFFDQREIVWLGTF